MPSASAAHFACYGHSNSRRRSGDTFLTSVWLPMNRAICNRLRLSRGARRASTTSRGNPSRLARSTISHVVALSLMRCPMRLWLVLAELGLRVVEVAEEPRPPELGVHHLWSLQEAHVLEHPGLLECKE